MLLRTLQACGAPSPCARATFEDAMTLSQLTKIVHGKVAYDYKVGKTATHAVIVHTFRTVLSAVRQGAVVHIPDFGAFRLHKVNSRYNTLPNGKKAYVKKRTELWFRPKVNIKEAPSEAEVEDAGRHDGTSRRITRPSKAPQAAARDRSRRK